MPVDVAFRAFQHACLSPSVPNVAVPAWEFPDLPDHAFDGEPRNDWVRRANRCSLVIVGGPFTAEAFLTRSRAAAKTRRLQSAGVSDTERPTVQRARTARKSHTARL